VCIHKRIQPGQQSSCAAFPAGIPRDLLTSRFDHRNPYPGDNGIGWRGDPGFEHPNGPLLPAQQHLKAAPALQIKQESGD
jgi:hypothetical protein